MSSLATFLLGSAEKKLVPVDKGLDAIFQTVGPSKAIASISQGVQNAVNTSPSLAGGGDKKRRLVASEQQDSKERKKARTGQDKSLESIGKIERPSKAAERERSSRKQRTAGSDPDEAPVAEPSTSVEQRVAPHEVEDGDNDEDDSDLDAESDPSKLVHESLLKSSQRKGNTQRSNRKFVPSDETAEQRNARTIFVGNVPIDVAKSKPLQKQFKRHFTTLVPTAKIESVRFRSVAFAAPTAKLPAVDAEAGKEKGKEKAPARGEKDGRQHDRDRAASWRAKKDDDDTEPDKQFLTPKEKKRIAFIKHELHSGVDAVNAYVVFAHPIPENGVRPKNVPPPAPTMEPSEAARLAAERCDGTVFLERTIRVDRVGEGSVDAQTNIVPAGDPKTTIFVGNLDFASKEEDLRAFFEVLIVVERGSPVESQGESSEDEESAEEDEVAESKVPVKMRTWVKRVRIVRDKDTQLGKGFAYVQFVDRQCVDEILALEESQLKFAKRKLRVQHCKTVPGGAKVVPKFAKPSPIARVPAARRPSTTSSPRGVAPRGNPALGEKISHLPKDERKKVKASDPDRIARRMAKKQAKTLAEMGVKSKPRMERDRSRKRPGEKKAITKQGEKKKGRLRSGNALAKMNTKK